MTESGYSVITIRKITDAQKGDLFFFECNKDIPFLIKRMYYINGVKKGVFRGGHAHKKLQQLLFCPYGQILVSLDNGKERSEILLNNSEKGILITSCVWRDILWCVSDSVLCVAVSDIYDENDYIRNYKDFRQYIDVEGEKT